MPDIAAVTGSKGATGAATACCTPICAVAGAGSEGTGGIAGPAAADYRIASARAAAPTSAAPGIATVTRGHAADGAVAIGI